MSQGRLIRKYPNRRLYDTAESRYITLADVRQLVKDGVEFNVVARVSQRDVTNEVLLQVIAEQERATPTMDRGFLTGLIRG